MRITILWSALAPYSVAFFKELASFQDCRLQLVCFPSGQYAPYLRFNTEFCEQYLDARLPFAQLEQTVGTFNPDIVLMSSWNFHHYRRLSRRLKRQGVFVVAAMDNQWRGRLRQYIGAGASRWLLKPCIDTFLVAGDRQAEFARRLGYRQVMHGLYAADVDRFLSPRSTSERPGAFLYVGRMLHIKGFDLLLAAYRQYREQTPAPWDLVVAGAGDLQAAAQNLEGIQHLGFVQSEALPAVMHAARCLVAPSRFEQWGVVIHEAAAAGLPVIATAACGAITAFVRDGVNGFIVSAHAGAIADAMRRISMRLPSEIDRMGEVSTTLAKLWTPQMLAAYFIHNLARRVID